MSAPVKGRGPGKMRGQLIEIGENPPIGFRFKIDHDDIWFGLVANGHETPIFSGLVGPEWPVQLRNLAHHVESILREASQ